MDVQLAEEPVVGEDFTMIFDYTHCQIDETAKRLLMEVAKETKIKEKIDAQFKGTKINSTEERPVLHTALRMSQFETLEVDGKNVVEEVHKVQERMQAFSKAIRSGDITGHTGKKLVNIVAIGIGGSFLGPEFVYEALKNDKDCKKASDGMTLKFLANVDPIDFNRALDGLNVEETLFIIVSKTFSTAETMLNARSCRKHILNHFKSDKDN